MQNCRTIIRQASQQTQPIELSIEDANHWGRHGIPGFQFEAHQLSPGPFLAITNFYPLGESHIQIISVDQRIAHWGKTEDYFVHLIYILQSPTSWKINGWTLHKGMALIIGEGVEIIGSIPADMRWCSLVIERSRLSDWNFGQSISHIKVFETHRDEAEKYEILLNHLSRIYPSKNSEAAQEFLPAKVEKLLLTHFQQMLKQENLLAACSRETNKLTLIRKTIVTMMSFPMDQLRMSHLSNACGACATTINAAFQDLWDISTIHFLLTLRLSGAKRELLESQSRPVLVTDVAISWGFWHFGRFAQYFKRQFGEVPSATLKRGTAGLARLPKLSHFQAMTTAEPRDTSRFLKESSRLDGLVTDYPESR